MKKTTKQTLLLLLALVMMLGLLSMTALAGTASAGETVTVRIIGEDSIILNDCSVDIDALAAALQTSDLTPDDSSKTPNALDAVLYATQQNSYNNDSYTVTYSAPYSSYSINKLVNLDSGNQVTWYWGTLAVSSSGAYDGSALSKHAVAAGDTYIVYCDKYTGTAYQSYACFSEDTISGPAGSIIPVEAITTGYDASWNTVASALAGVTIYNNSTAVAVTDSDGKAYISFADAGIYTLTLSSDYTYAQCVVTVTGSSVILNDVSINVTDGANNLSNASLTLTNSSGNHTYSPYEISSGTYKYRLQDGIYNYFAKANGYIPYTDLLKVFGTTLTPNSIALTAMSGYEVTITTGDPDETVIVANSSGNENTAISRNGSSWTYDLTNGTYTYTVNRNGYHSYFGNFTVNGAALSRSVDLLTDTAASSAEWPAFRNFSNNMAIVTCPTAQGSWQTEEKWAASLGSLGSWGTLSASNIVLYDGYLYVATEHGLAKIDKSTGGILTTTALSADASYVTQVAYGDGKVFVTTASGIDAFDALTMKLLWSCNDFDTYGSAYMCSTPILYNSGTIYVGNDGCSTYNSVGTYGGYSAIDTTTGKVKWTSWGKSDTVYYSAGAVLAGQYLVFGGDDGYLRAIDTSAATVNQYYGLITTPTTLSVTGKVRSSITYDSSYLYFTTNNGYIFKVSIDSSTGELTNVNSRQFSTAGTSSTPVVYQGRIYVSASDGIYVLKADDLTEVSHYAAGAAVQTSALLTTAYGGTVYAYFTVNSPQGEIIVLSDDGTNVAYNTLYTPAQNQYSLVSLIADLDGTLYYTNDSGYIFAIQNNNEPKTNLVRTTISVSPASVPITGTATYPTITVKDSNGTEVSTAVPGIYYLAVDSYRYTVSLSGYTNATGTFTVTTDDVANSSKTVSVALSTPSTGPSPSTSTVTFKLQDVASAFSKSVTVVSDSTVYDVFVMVMNAQGVTYTLEGGGYIKTIDGLSEGDNGAKSGWMYKVNGTHPTVGITDYYVKSGDVIVFHFSDEYTQEKDSDNWRSDTSSSLPVKDISDAEPESLSFIDVATNTWYYDAVKFVNEYGLFSGTSATTFEPGTTMTRAMFVTVLARLNEADLSGYPTSVFSDIDISKWYGPSVAWAAANGIVEGSGGDLFGPDDEITREQMCVLLVRFAGFAGIELSSNPAAIVFEDDGEISNWAHENVGTAQQAELIVGKGNNLFDPQGTATRAEVATIFMRLSLLSGREAVV